MADDVRKAMSVPASQAARRLLGCELVRELDGQVLRGRIVETEAYDQTDAASHSYKGRTPRADVMFGPAGHLYVYFTYGMHYCCNIVSGQEGEGSGVLIRALEPLQGATAMSVNRRGLSGKLLTNGPAKVCQALSIDRSFNGHDVRLPPIRLVLQPALAAKLITQTTRIGISRAAERPWRYYITGNEYVSQAG